MDEIDEIWVIYRRNLGQNSRWNINLLLKINFSRWIKNWVQSGRWIAILPLKSHLDRRINTGVIWTVRSHCMKEGTYHQKISDISPIYHRFFATSCHFLKNLRYISLHRYIGDILAIFMEISPLRFFSMKYRVDPSQYTIYRRYIPIFSSMITANLEPNVQKWGRPRLSPLLLDWSCCLVFNPYTKASNLPISKRCVSVDLYPDHCLQTRIQSSLLQTLRLVDLWVKGTVPISIPNSINRFVR